MNITEYKKENKNKNKQEEHMFLKACEIEDIDYVISNIKTQEKNKNIGLSIACKHRNISIIDFLIKEGAYKCNNCRSHGTTDYTIYYKENIENNSMSFGDKAKLLQKKWKEINNIEFKIYKNKAVLYNQTKLQCMNQF